MLCLNSIVNLAKDLDEKNLRYLYRGHDGHGTWALWVRT
jgi:hypothetical protein